MGGDRVNYHSNCGSTTASMLTVKLLINSVISMQGKNVTTTDIKDFNLNTLIQRYEYMQLKLEELHKDFTEDHKLQEKVTNNGYVYVEICK